MLGPSDSIAGACPASSVLGAVFGSFARASLTLDWGSSPEQSAALLRTADPLDPLRCTPLCRCRGPSSPAVPASAASAASAAVASDSAASAASAAVASDVAPESAALTAALAAAVDVSDPPSGSEDADELAAAIALSLGAAAPAAGDERLRWWRPDGSRPLKRCGFATHRLVVASAGSGSTGGSADWLREATVCVHALPPSDAATVPCELIVAVVGFDPTACSRHDDAVPRLACTAAGATAARLRFTPRPGVEYLLSVCAAPARDTDFDPLPWGRPPSQQPTYAYVLGLDGCAPHPSVASRGAASWQPPPGLAPLSTSADGWVAVPTGLEGMQPLPRLSGGGASLYDRRDVRSGNPREVNTVLLTRALLAVKGRTIARVRLSYRVVVGYSGVEGAPGPSFRLELVDGSDEPGGGGDGGGGGGSSDSSPSRGCGAVCCHGRTIDASTACVECEEEEGSTFASALPRTHVLFTSPEFESRPHSWDAATGGSPTNYSAPVDVDLACTVGPLRGAHQTLRIVFKNGKRNLHLQGGGWPASGCCELALQLQLS